MKLDKLPAIIPLPAQQTWRPERFEFDSKTVFVATGTAEKEARKLAASLRLATGLPLSVTSSQHSASSILLVLDPAAESRLGKEGYRLEVARNQVIIKAATEAGLFYGGVTLRQLLPPEIVGPHRLASPPPGGWTMPCVTIEDAPRFPWRGLLLDVARHFFPPDDLKPFIDAMAEYKFNTLQLHLTDDQGWRVEIKKYPRLTQVGAARQESPRRGDREHGDGTPYGPYYYTQEQLRDLVAYARERHIEIVPEIEIPGHFLAALAAYPDLSCAGGPFAVRTRWGIDQDVLCVGNDRACEFVQDALAEIVQIFPSRFIHIGGDEAPRDRWQNCAKCQKRMKDEGLTQPAQLQTWLNHRLEGFLARQGRRLIGWDEILEGGLTPGAAVMSWRGVAGGMAAANAGHDVVMSPTTHCYLDYAQAKGPTEPESIGGYLPLEQVYAFEPVPADLPLARRHHILGGQGNLWTEYIQSRSEVEYFVYPRAAALAEALWSPPEVKAWAGFKVRFQAHQARLAQRGVNYRPLDP